MSPHPAHKQNIYSQKNVTFYLQSIGELRTYRFVIIINVYLSHVVLAPKWCCFRTKMLQCYMLDNFNKCLKSVNHDAFAHQSSVVFAPKLDSIYVLEKFNKYFKSVNHDAFV